jgi:hypothetical protein
LAEVLRPAAIFIEAGFIRQRNAKRTGSASRVLTNSVNPFTIEMERFPSIDEAKMDILTENLDSVFCNLSIANVLKAFCLNPHEESE